MQGLMQQSALTVDTILDHANRWHGDREVVSRSVEGPIVRTTYGQMHDRAKRVSNALLGLGIKLGDRVATLAWNTGRHMEAWYGIMGIGAVCHTLNPRLHPDQIAWIVRHAEDRIIFVDLTFVPILEEIIANCPSVEHVIVFTDNHHMVPFQVRGVPNLNWKGAHTYETLVEGSHPDVAWGGFDENTAAGLCYTSGTTGDPKGVLYSHRSNYLHTLVGLQRDVLGVSALDTVLPVVPMFHANAWGIAFAGPGVGAKLVMPGSKMDGESIHQLLESESVTFSAAVPTVWQMLLQHLDKTNGKLSTLKRVVIGGSACPEAIILGFHDRYGVDVLHAWGMTETSPLGTLGTPNARIAALPYDEQMVYKLKQGRPPLGIDLKLTDDAGHELPHDGRTFGNLKVRGPFVVREYFKGAGGRILDGEGYFDTGDVATIDAEGFMQITDRAKDVIKSGGEWISTIDIENIAMGHPKVALAAVIGMPHPKWDERPLLLIKLKDGEKATKEEMLRFLEGKIAKWWMPDDVAFVDDIPLGATGKIDKKLIRERMKDYVLPSTPVLAATVVAEKAAPDPVLHAPEPAPPAPEPVTHAPEPTAPESPAGKSEAPAGVAAVGANEPVDAEFEDKVPAAIAAATAAAAAAAVAAKATAESRPEPVEEHLSWSSSDREDDGDVPAALPSMPDMTPMAGGKPAPKDAPLSLKPTPVRGSAPSSSEAPLAFTPVQPGDARRKKGKSRSKARADGKTGRGFADLYLDLALLVSLAPAGMWLAGALASNFHLITPEQGFDMMLIQGPTRSLGWAPAIALVGVLTGMIGMLVAVFGGFRRLWAKALLPLLVTALTWGSFIGFGLWDTSIPLVHDVSTDWQDPLMFSPTVLKVRGPDANPVDPSPILPLGSRAYAGRAVADVNAETCPAARPVTIAASAAQAFNAAKAAVEGAGMSIITADPASGRIEATAVSLLYGFQDDVVVRVRQTGGGARIDLRAVRRTGAGDMGANCRHIETLVQALAG